MQAVGFYQSSRSSGAWVSESTIWRYVPQSVISFVALAALAPIQTISILDDRAHLLNTFVPRETLGAGVDGHEFGDARKIYRPEILKQMRAVGFSPLTYRLRTELGVETWHWNPKGKWSGNNEGYWTSSTHSTGIEVSYGYRLPRRGDSGDQANDDSYSRIDDGDPKTFWKSNPYLARPFTHESDERHPQDIYINLDEPKPIDTIVINWASPFAVRYSVAYWDGENRGGESDGDWKAFPGGDVVQGTGGVATLKLADSPVKAQWIRVRMAKSSYTSLTSSRDIRDRSGYAVREIAIGVSQNGKLTDWVEHGKRGHQSFICVTSTDPWHRAVDVDRSTEQPGLDLVARSGLMNGQPLLVPVPTLYGTPEDAAGMVRYLRSKHIPLRGIELGEEPDGQSISPEDYAALYGQMAQAIRRVDGRVRLGGPSFETIQADAFEFPHPEWKTWIGRFLDAMRDHGRLSLFQFCSFEWYGWDNVVDGPKQLRGMKDLLETSVKNLWSSGLPRTFPLYISEYGWSPYSAQTEVDVDAGLFDAETLGVFLSLGGRAAYLYGYEPSNLMLERPRNGWGDNMLFLGDDDRQPVARVARYWTSWMLTHCWASPGDKALRLYEAHSEAPVRAYPLRLPGGGWSISLLNEDATRSETVQLENLSGALEMRGEAWQYSREQYSWKADGPRGHPSKSDPPAHLIVSGPITLPPFSLTVVRLGA